MGILITTQQVRKPLASRFYLSRFYQLLGRHVMIAPLGIGELELLLAVSREHLFKECGRCRHGIRGSLDIGEIAGPRRRGKIRRAQRIGREAARVTKDFSRRFWTFRRTLDHSTNESFSVPVYPICPFCLSPPIHFLFRSLGRRGAPTGHLKRALTSVRP